MKKFKIKIIQQKKLRTDREVFMDEIHNFETHKEASSYALGVCKGLQLAGKEPNQILIKEVH